MYRKRYSAPPGVATESDDAQGKPGALATTFLRVGTVVVVLSVFFQLAVIISAIMSPHPSGGGGSLGSAVIAVMLFIFFIPPATLTALVLAIVYSVRQGKEGGAGLAVAFFWFATLLPLGMLYLMEHAGR